MILMINVGGDKYQFSSFIPRWVLYFSTEKKTGFFFSSAKNVMTMLCASEVELQEWLTPLKVLVGNGERLLAS